MVWTDPPDRDDDEYPASLEGPEARMAREQADAEARWHRRCDLTIVGLLASLSAADLLPIPRWKAQWYWHLPRWHR